MSLNIPSVSILLPIRNEEPYIQNTLATVLAQDYVDAQIEILVIDGMSSDHTREIVVEIQKNHPERAIRLLDNPQKIVSTGLNIGLRQAKGEVIIRVDGHCEIAADYVRQCVNLLMETDADNVGGRMTAIASSPFGGAVAVATSTPFGVGGARFHYAEAEEWVDTVYLGAWHKSIFDRTGYFDEELVRDQDDEFNYRLRSYGGKVLLSPSIQSIYYTRSTARSLWRQYFQYGFWKVRVLQKHPAQMRPRQFVPFLFVLSLIGSGALGIFSVWGKWLLAGILGAYLVANLAASVWTASKKGWRYLGSLPFVFTILHLSYGFGFLAGLIRFIRRWGDKVGKVPDFQGSDA